MGKIYASETEALAGLLRDGLHIAVGGFGLNGIPEHCLRAIKASGVKDLTIYTIAAGTDDAGPGLLMENHQISTIVVSYVGENSLLTKQFLDGSLKIDFTPQGTLAERLRAGGAGIPAFYTKTGVGTVVAEGKEVRTFDGVDYLMERAIIPDLALVKAWKADEEGNLIFRKSARNLNPIAAQSARLTIAEVEHIVPSGSLDADQFHLPGAYVHRLFEGKNFEKRIERRTTRAA